jgi:hypothetical protein
MKPLPLRLTVLFLFLPLLLATSGCVAVAVGGAAAGTVAWIRGALEVAVDSPIDKVGKAATEAMTEMKFSVISSKVDVVSGAIVARTAQDVKVEIRLNKITEKSTKVSIRVGIFGDQALSQQIYDALRENL